MREAAFPAPGISSSCDGVVRRTYHSAGSKHVRQPVFPCRFQKFPASDLTHRYTKIKATIMDKSAIKKASKQAKKLMGVYRIRNSHNATTYIGFATDLHSRINRHKAELKFGSHRNRQLQEIWNSSGESAFEFEVLDVLDHDEDSNRNPANELQILTEMWIHKLEKTADCIVRL